MGLFNKKTKNEEPKKGNIPERLGIKQERADEIIEAVLSSYADNTGNVSKAFEDIFEESLDKSEHSFACYVLGCIKTKTEANMEEVMGDSLEGLEKLLKMLEKKIGE